MDEYIEDGKSVLLIAEIDNDEVSFTVFENWYTDFFLNQAIMLIDHYGSIEEVYNQFDLWFHGNENEYDLAMVILESPKRFNITDEDVLDGAKQDNQSGLRIIE